MNMNKFGPRGVARVPRTPPLDPPMVKNFSCEFEAKIQSTINDQYCLGADESEAQRRKQEDEEADDLRQIRRQCE